MQVLVFLVPLQNKQAELWFFNMSTKIHKTISPILRFGKYKISDLAIPFAILGLAFFVNWENYFSDYGIGFRVMLVLLASYFWKLVKFLQNKVVRGYKTHVLYKLGLKNNRYFPRHDEKEFIG